VSVIGQRVLRKEDHRFLVGQGQYVDNLPLENALRVTFVRSPMAHARITAVDVSAATALPGVKVFTASDIDLGKHFVPPPFGVDEAFWRPFVARDTVRFVGDIVAVVLSESRAIGEDAAELVMVDYEPLPVVVDARRALDDEVLLFPGAGTNVVAETRPATPDPGLFEDCEIVVSGALVSQRMAACPLEPRSSAATFEKGKLTAWLSTQTPHQDRDGLAASLGLDVSQVRVVGPDVGGGFGAKGFCPEDVLIGWLARSVGRPVRWTETRSENMVAMNHGRAQVNSFTIGAGRDGTVRALRIEILQDIGAYPGLGTFLPNLTALMASGVYRIPKIESSVTVVVTNTTTVSAFRGAGRPEAAQTIERAMDMLAAALAMDPAELRRRNFIRRDAFPHLTASGATYDAGDYERALDLVLATAGYAELRVEQARRRQEPGAKQMGIGISTYVEITNGLPEGEFGEVEIQPDGSALLRTGSFSHGQGHETTFAQIVADRLGVAVERVTVHKGDTDEIARGTGTYGSKSAQIGGAAAAQAAEEVVERARSLFADLLEANPDDIVFDRSRGEFHVAGSPDTALDWSALADRGRLAGRLEDLKAHADFQPSASTFPFGAHIAVVEVDTETGRVELQRLVAVDDAGTVINPMIVRGQVIGGIATGISQALYEEVTYNEEGSPQTANFVGYAFPSAADMPSFETVEMVTPTPLNPLGAKGIGESGTIGATPAVHNAVIDALAPFGIKHIDMPVNGESVWRALQEATG
jgi:aerobic carbon-monoxide dehydrogenase large subunit